MEERLHALLLEAEALGRERLSVRGVAETGDVSGPELVRDALDPSMTFVAPVVAGPRVSTSSPNATLR